MDPSTFGDILLEAIIAAVEHFCDGHPKENPYAFTLIAGQSGNYLGFAIATEERLQETATAYDKEGYRYQGWEWETFDNREKLVTWLRWAHPDDGWYYGDFAERFQIVPTLNELFLTGQLKDDDGIFEEFCTNTLERLQRVASWKEHPVASQLFVGFTYGENSRNFLRTATRANPYPKVLSLWDQHWEADELDSRIQSPQ